MKGSWEIMLFMFCFIAIIIILLWVEYGYADSSIEMLARDGISKSQGMALSESSGSAIPGYSEQKARDQANDIDHIDDAELKNKAHLKMQSADANSPEGITRDAMNKKTIDGYENQEIFIKADEINLDPIAAFEKITKEGCKEKEKEQKNQYKKAVKKEKITDTELYEETCEKPSSNTVCEKNLSVSCKQAGDCDSGGIVKASVSSDMKFEYSYPYLTIGTIADNYWGGRCDAYDRVTKFQVRNKEEIREFKIVQVGFDDYLWIKVNGHNVYVGPDGGDRLEIVEQKSGWFRHKVVETGNGRRSCERETNWNFNVDINLLPYLKEGENEIWMRVIVAGAGEGWMRIIAKQHCCMSWQEQWEKRCWSE
jgi:hypothetical protein